MTAGFCKCKRSLGGALAVGVVAFSASVYGQDFRWVAVPNGGGEGNIGQTAPDCVISTTTNPDDTITCPGGGRRVHFSIGLTGWTGVELGAWQATVDGTTLGPMLPIEFAVPADRPIGAYQVLRECFSGASDGLACGNTGTGPYGAGLPGVTEPECQADGGFFCSPNAQFVLACCDPVAAVSVASINYSWGGAPGPNATSGQGDGATVWYGGDYVLEIPAGEAGSWAIGFLDNINLTFMNDFGSGSIGVQDLFVGYVNIPTGKCCNPGAVVTCSNDVTEEDCGGDWTEGAVCLGPVAPAPADPIDCIVCENDADCDDGNACTTDVCTPQGCTNEPNYDVLTECCDPATGNVILIDDGVECTDCVCDDATGQVTCSPSQDGAPCDDGNPCTIDDDCTGGACGGDLVGEIYCDEQTPCPPVGQGCDLETNLCICNVDTELCVNPTPGVLGDPNCYEEDELVHYTVQMGGGTVPVSGGQFLMSYDPDCMTFVDIDTCESSIFQWVIESDVDETTGTIFFAVVTDVWMPTATTEPADLACLTFQLDNLCTPCTVCLEDENPRHTLLSSDTGNRVPIAPCDCGKPVRQSGDITLTTPPGESVNADCDLPTAMVTWDAVTATDECDGPLTVNCQSQHDGGDPPADAVMGGMHTQGTTFHMCWAENSCGDIEKHVWTVAVSSNQSLDVAVHLSPEMNPGVFTRAITFNLYNDDNCTSAPTEECGLVTFNGPYNWPGHGTATLKAAKGQYTCITAQDCLHTLRAAAEITCVDGRWGAEFKGANWLLGGNLDCWKADATAGDKNCINILDFSMFMAEIAAGAVYPDGDTDCETPGPHGDINADGLVDGLDYTFILDNFLECTKDLCCPDPLSRGNDGLRASISTRELRMLGRGREVVADLNGDGWVDEADMAAFAAGVRPVEKKRGNR